ncbi:hypothetical protein G6F22_018922 [Rhizopus arrhizus]|uniref:Uncharacterized protein n=1 Tax=Rhizopus delemar TaxID=936053 RepID=A0A9P6XNV5_9FUNG|nr:hypothetical protein G6F24_014211 [Rhizopus arrhizus]KAG0761246.1 hypothetical protein G6F22_018922 [Rhizopus arrhizus]KAG1529660.1 hypothetical protein G6F50_017851 [Rhizopus delemar]
MGAAWVCANPALPRLGRVERCPTALSFNDRRAVEHSWALQPCSGSLVLEAQRFAAHRRVAGAGTSILGAPGQAQGALARADLQVIPASGRRRVPRQ